MWFKPKEFVKNKKFSISKNYFEYTEIDSVKEIIEIVKDTEVNFNELICKNDPVKPYFDIESTTEFDINQIVKTMKKVFNELYTITLTDSDIYILECNRIVKEQFKWSYHVIIDNYHFLDKTQAKFAAMDLNDYHPEIDLSVYSDGYQNIRMLNCVKKGENVPFKLIGRDSDSYSDEIFGRSLITNVNEDSICIEFVFEDTPVLSENEFLSIVPLIEKDLGTKIFGIKECKNYITFNYNHNFKCLFGEEHSSLGHCVNKIENGVFSITCFSSKCKGKKTYRNDCGILKELDKFSEHSEAKDYNIKHYELIKNTKKTITAAIQSNLEPFHNFISKCKNANLYSECTKDGYRVSCKNCDFKFPPDNSIPLDKVLTPQIFNILINNVQEDINNKDTSQVAEKLLTYINLIYTDDKKWYLYNEESGIYENKSDGVVLGLMKIIANKMKENDIEEEWHNWINKVGYKENLLRELKIECLKENIKIDDNKFLLGFPNGVLDLNSGIFRKGKIDEYVTMKCGIEYNENIDTNLALKYLSDVFPDKDECDYTLNKFALTLEGYNREQMVTFSYGYTASNGKSYTMDRIRDIMGDYGGTFAVTLLTNKMKGAGEANSSLIKFHKKRFMYCSEPEANSKLNTNFVKVLTGDKITARAVYAEKEIEMYPSYKIFICCNVLPDFDTYDEGIARRIAITEYKTKFCENPKKKNERVLKKYSDEDDENLSRSLLKLLVDRYTLLRNNKFSYSIPKDIQSMQNMYLDDNKNVIKDILFETYEIGNEKDYVKNKDIKFLLEKNDIKKDVNTVKKIVQDIFCESEFKIDGKIDGDRVRNVFCKLRLKNL